MGSFNYESAKLGERFKSKFDITKKLVRDFVSVVEETIEISETAEIPNYVFSLYTPVHDAMGSLAQGTIHIKQKMRHFANAYIGDELDVIVTVVNKYKKREKRYLIIEVDFIKSDILVCRHETTHIWGLTSKGVSS